MTTVIYLQIKRTNAVSSIKRRERMTTVIYLQIKRTNAVSSIKRRERMTTVIYLHMNNILDNNFFLKTMQPIFSDKGLSKNAITLFDGKIWQTPGLLSLQM